MTQVHEYRANILWTGAERGPTSSYSAYSRDYVVEIAGKAPLRGSSDAIYRGDASLHNPEDLLVAALSACHMLSYLALCARAGVAVVAYEDSAHGTMTERDGAIRFIDVTLRPTVAVAAGSDRAKAEALHAQAHRECFIANSVNFPVRHEATVRSA